MDTCSVAMLLGKSVWIKTRFFMASDPEGMNYFTEWVPARDTGREIPYLWIWKGFTDQCFKICVIIKPKFLGVQNTLRGEDSMLQSI